MTYKTSTENKALEIVNVKSLEGKVKQSMEAAGNKGAFGYIRGGSEDEWTLNENTSAFNKKQIMPRVLRGIDSADLSTSLFGIKLKTPIIQAPVAAQGLAHEEGEVATAKAMAEVGSIFSISTYGSTSVEDAAKAAPGAPQFFQLYMAGVKAIILTADSTLGGYREEDIVNHFQFPLPMPNLAAFSESDGTGKGISEIYAAAKQGLVLEDIQKIKKITNLPVIVKGVQSPIDADDAINAGADGIWVSNHGGRQLDGGPASIDVLPLIAKSVNHRVPIVFDSGIRRGEHVFKALAQGADVVAVGRPVLYGLNLGGAKGVQSVFEHLNKELSITMQLAGTKNIEEIKHTSLID
ncbi:lactate oxidase [Lactococcus lactis]|uniref:lactate oxidase n=1 Tax=Lactococcus lactis TaxID=1358 RepID=UPI00223A8B2E|nr:lactate oxidase [Lactococcus lactis]MCT1182694.1 lactate oxidase [Lactococcus lactis]